MTYRNIIRLFCIAAVTATGWLVVGAGPALAIRPPDPEESLVSLSPIPAPDSTPFMQFVMVAALACLLSVAATIAIQAIIRRSHRALAEA